MRNGIDDIVWEYDEYIPVQCNGPYEALYMYRCGSKQYSCCIMIYCVEREVPYFKRGQSNLINMYNLGLGATIDVPDAFSVTFMLRIDHDYTYALRQHFFTVNPS